MKKVQGYKCDYCHRVFGRPVDAHNHEICCGNNPNSRRCITCINCKIREDKSVKLVEFDHETLYGSSPTCVISNKPIYDKPYLDECETHGYSDYGGEETPTPGTCWNYEYKGYSGYEKREAEEECISQEDTISLSNNSGSASAE
jgi:hypothetical protein